MSEGSVKNAMSIGDPSPGASETKEKVEQLQYSVHHRVPFSQVSCTLLYFVKGNYQISIVFHCIVFNCICVYCLTALYECCLNVGKNIVEMSFNDRKLPPSGESAKQAKSESRRRIERFSKCFN